MGPAYHKRVPCPWGSLKIPLMLGSMVIGSMVVTTPTYTWDILGLYPTDLNLLPALPTGHPSLLFVESCHLVLFGEMMIREEVTTSTSSYNSMFVQRISFEN